MIKRLTKYLYILLFFIPGFSEAQTHDLKFTTVTGENGVFLGKINDITQDKNGTIWFSDQTNRGITKYDGTRMTRYQNDSRKTNSLGGIYPECLFADSSGIIWIGFYGYGLDRFDPENNIFTHFRHDPNDSQSIANDTVTAVLIDHLNNVWVATYGGLDLLDPATGKFSHFAHDPSDPASLSWNIIRALYEDREGTIWVGTGLAWHTNQNGGLNRFDRKSGTFTRYLHNPENPYSLSNNKVRAIFEDSKGTFWVGSMGKNGLQSLDRKTGIFTTYPLGPKTQDSPSRPPVKSEFDHITFLTEDAEKCLWIGTLANGISRFNPQTKTTSHYTSQTASTKGFKDDSGWTAYASPDGWLWISTQEANLYKVDLYINKFIPDNSIGLPINGMYSENADVVWFATEAGLFRRDFNIGSTQHYPIDPGAPYRSTTNQVYDVYPDHDGIFWLSSPQGLIRFDQKTKATTRYRYNPADDSSISWDDISQVYQDSESNLFVCTYGGGLNLMDTKTGTFLHYVHDEEDSTSLSGNIITSILEDETKDYWIGTWTSGINRMDRKTRRCKRYLADITVIEIIKDNNQTIWVGASNGLYRYNRVADSFDPVVIGGVPVSFDELKSLVQDKTGMLWISTLSGLFKVDPENDHYNIYGKENGISTADFYYSSACVRENGEILIGSALGYYHFYPDKIKTPAVKPHIFLTSFFLKGQLIKPASGNILTEVIGNTREIHLSYDQNVFSFSFTGIDYGADISKAVYYKLENYDPEWRVAGSDGQIYYFNIPPGMYNLRIKAVNSTYGTFDEKQLAIIITPPWYSTWWAYGLYILGALLLIFSTHRILKARVIKAEKEKNREHELAQAREIEKAYHQLKNTQAQLIQSEKMASLGELTAGIAHEIQNPLNFINNFAEVNAELIDELHEGIDNNNLTEVKSISKHIRDNEEKIIFHGKRADAIVKGMLQHSRSSSGVKEPTDINALADEYLRLAYHGLRAKDKSFNAMMKTDFDDTIGMVNVIPQDIGRVILNLITNAFYAVSEKQKALQTPYPLEGGPDYQPTVTVMTKHQLPLSGGRGSDGANGLIEISISDNGPGIPKSAMDKIFQPFFTTKPTGQGTGLGLSLSYDIIKAHAGELKVETKEGEGTVFTIQLPVS